MEDASGKLKLHRCKAPARPGGRALSNLVPKYYGQGGDACLCAGSDYKLSLAGRRKKFFNKSKCGGPGGGAGGVGRDRAWGAPSVRSPGPTDTGASARRPSGARLKGEGHLVASREQELKQGRGWRERGPTEPFLGDEKPRDGFERKSRDQICVFKGSSGSRWDGGSGHGGGRGRGLEQEARQETGRRPGERPWCWDQTAAGKEAEVGLRTGLGGRAPDTLSPHYLWIPCLRFTRSPPNQYAGCFLGRSRHVWGGRTF